MNIDNIKKIMNDSIWKDIIKEENYEDYKIINRKSKQFNALFIFFNSNIGDNSLRLYGRVCRMLSTREGVCIDILKVYDLKILVIS